MRIKRFLLIALVILLVLPRVFAENSVYRALCVSISGYDDGRTRVGGTNSAQGVYDALSRSFGSKGSFISALVLNPTKDELFEAIKYTFEDAGENDVSLIYINAHGGAQGGIARIETREGASLNASELEAETRKIPGKIILLIDACNSGGFIGSQSDMYAMFTGTFGQSSFAGDKYLVLASCFLDENSYRVTAGSADESSVSTVFARALCEGLGWDLINDRSTALKADVDHDRTVTFAEIYMYVKRRSTFYLSSSLTSMQTASAFAPNANLVLADRNP